MALLSSLFDNMGQLAPQESPTDELMRRALELNKNAAQPQGIMVSRPDMPDVVNRILGPQQAPEPAQIGGSWEPTVAPAPAPIPQQAPASAPQPQAVSRPIALPPLNQAAASAVPQRQPTFMDRMAAFASGYQGGGLIGGIANAAQGPDKAVQLENQTAQLLAGRLGVTPTEALALAKRPDIMQQLLPVLTNKGRKTAVINGRLVDEQSGQIIADFSDTNRQGPEIKALKNADGEDVNFVYDAQQKKWVPLDMGNIAPAPAQPSPGAQPAIPPPPPGVNKAEWRKGYTSEIAKSTAAANAALPGAIAQTERLISSIEAVEKDPQLNKVIGPLDANTPTILPASKSVESRLNEIEKQSFMQAFESLKGAGAITEQEGKAAQQSLNRLSARDVSEGDYRKALSEFKANVKTMLDTAKVKAGRLSPDQAAARREARDAIQRGAPANLVMQRLQENGIDGAGL